jgi:hypothetical protein
MYRGKHLPWASQRKTLFFNSQFLPVFASSRGTTTTKRFKNKA